MKNIILIFLLISLDFLAEPLYAQTVEYDYYYRVYFKDKGENHISDFTPSELFTQRAIDRREKNGIMSLDYKDIPVVVDRNFITADGPSSTGRFAETVFHSIYK